MTRVISVNYARGHSSIVSTNAGRILEGRVLMDPAFPTSTIRSLKDVHNDWEYAVCCVPELFDDFKTQIKSITSARPILTDYREALAMSSIAMNNWDSCAVMVVDSHYCSLGYYAGNQFYWLREFCYPNSISLFYSAATRFLGFDPMLEEHKLVDASQLGQPAYSQIILDKLVHTGHGEYTILQNLTRGVGVGPLNLDIAASVQHVFSTVILHLANWLSKAVNSTRLAYAGRATLNYLTNTRIVETTNFNELLIQPLTSHAGAVVGSASLVSRSIFDTTTIGPSAQPTMTPDELVKQLLRGEIIKFIGGNAEFSDLSLANCNWLAIPFADRVSDFRKHAKLNYNWQQPTLLCQERDYNTYFANPITPTYGQYQSINTGYRQLGRETVRVAAINNRTNPYIHRVLELLRVEGYPILLSAPIL